MPVEVGLERAAARGEADRFEQEQVEFFVRVREVFLARAAAYSDRFRVVDAAQPLEAVQNQIGEILNKFVRDQQS